jgi:hypothetical protein
MSYFSSKTLLAAKSLSAKDWSHPNVIQAARHLAHDGKSIDEINEAVGWNVSQGCARRRLAGFNIHPLPKSRRSPKLGYLTTLSCKTNGVNQQSFKARTIARAECL